MVSHHVHWHEEFPAECRGGAVTIGNFDGVHRGHAALVAQTAATARQLGGPVVVVTFDPHPLALLRPEKLLPQLTSSADRVDLLQQLGADHVLALQTNQTLLDLRAEEFFTQVIRQRLAAHSIVEGPNFAFGRGREGNVELLRRFCFEAGINLTVFPPVTVDGIVVSSSQIRECLGRGDVAQARRMLGRPYLLRGVVVTGNRRGHTIGFPTANLAQIGTVIPADGVYAVRACGVDGQDYPAAANVGPCPTFGEQDRSVEVHLIGYEGDLYGRTLAIEFIQRLRDTRKFAGPEELRQQLGRDVEQTLGMLKDEG